MKKDTGGNKNNGRKVGSKNKLQGELKPKENIYGSIKGEDKSLYQGLTRKEFLQVRAGESFEKWEERTMRKRIFGRTKDNSINVAQNGKLHVFSRKLPGMKKEVQLVMKSIINERMFDFFRAYSAIMRWASVRYDILKDDIEIAFFFYNGHPFTKEEFHQYCIVLGTVRGVFPRFLRKGYLKPISIISSKGNVVDTQYYCLSLGLTMLITRIYSIIAKLDKMQTDDRRGKLSDELKQFIIKLNDEVNETISGEKPIEKTLLNEDNP